MKKLKIAVLASNFIRIPPRPSDVPPQCSGAAEKIAHLISEGLIKRGHQVTLFASGDSKTKAELISVTKKSTGTDPKIGFNPAGPKLHEKYEYLLISKAYQMAQQNRFDIIHSHFDILTAFFAPLVKTPTVSTLHSRLSSPRMAFLKNFKKTQYYVSISDSQRKPIPDLNYAATIYHGIEIEKIPFGDSPENFLAIVGRINPQKGIKEAIEVAKKIGMKLVIMGSHGENDPYWENEIKPAIDGKQIIYKGFISQEETFKIIKKAKAYILPLQWEEPFGLTMIEAMACGTPAIAFDRGSAKEVISDKKSGFIVKNEPQMIDAIKNVDKIDRQYCREWVKNNFTVEKMVENYEKVYEKILKS
jgi:glycosyltransferase involved in cell wall biosynthesis